MTVLCKVTGLGSGESCVIDVKRGANEEILGVEIYLDEERTGPKKAGGKGCDAAAVEVEGDAWSGDEKLAKTSSGDRLLTT